MDLSERVLYHQVHPLKLATDWLTAAIGAALLWNHHAVSALVVGVGSRPGPSNWAVSSVSHWRGAAPGCTAFRCWRWESPSSSRAGSAV
jgi:hypothetical protein